MKPHDYAFCEITIERICMTWASQILILATTSASRSRYAVVMRFLLFLLSASLFHTLFCFCLFAQALLVFVRVLRTHYEWRQSSHGASLAEASVAAYKAAMRKRHVLLHTSDNAAEFDDNMRQFGIADVHALWRAAQASPLHSLSDLWQRLSVKKNENEEENDYKKKKK